MVTGVRWAESNNRKQTHGVANIQGKPKHTRRIADEYGAEYKLNKHGEVIMNDDNDANRRMLEHCYRTQKTMVNPIVDWTDEDVWDFLNENNIPHCCLYDEGYTRLGCIGCPLAGTKQMLRDFERYPKYKEAYIRAFQRMIDNHPGQIKILDPNSDTKFKLDVPDEIGGGVGFGIGSNGADGEDRDDVGSEFAGGGSQVLLPNRQSGISMVSQRKLRDAELKPCSGSSPQTVTDNSAGGVRILAEAMFRRWIRFSMC